MPEGEHYLSGRLLRLYHQFALKLSWQGKAMSQCPRGRLAERDGVHGQEPRGHGCWHPWEAAGTPGRLLAQAAVGEEGPYKPWKADDSPTAIARVCL